MDQQSWAESEQDIESEAMKIVSFVPNKKCAVAPQDRRDTGHWTAGGQVRRGGSGACEGVKSSQASSRASPRGCRL